MAFGSTISGNSYEFLITFGRTRLEAEDYFISVLKSSVHQSASNSLFMVTSKAMQTTWKYSRQVRMVAEGESLTPTFDSALQASEVTRLNPSKHRFILRLSSCVTGLDIQHHTVIVMISQLSK